MSDRNGKRMAVYGFSGSGKTYYVRKRILASLDRVVVFDPEEEFAEEKGFIRAHGLSDFLNILHDNWDSTFRIAMVPRDGHEELYLHEVSRIIERMQEPYKRGENDRKVTFVVDELNLSFPVNWNRNYDAFARICSKGRKRGINVIGITQRPAEVATRFRGNCDRVVAFSLPLPNDQKVIRETMGHEAEDALRELPKYGFLMWEGGKFQICPPT